MLWARHTQGCSLLAICKAARGRIRQATRSAKKRQKNTGRARLRTTFIYKYETGARARLPTTLVCTSHSQPAGHASSFGVCRSQYQLGGTAESAGVKHPRWKPTQHRTLPGFASHSSISPYFVRKAEPAAPCSFFFDCQFCAWFCALFLFLFPPIFYFLFFYFFYFLFFILFFFFSKK